MGRKDLSDLPEYGGLYFDPDTGKMYREDGTDTTFTFERATWTGPFGVQFQWPWLNPIGFATRETALRALDFVKSILPDKLAVTLDEVNRITGPFTRTVERQIVVFDGDLEQSFSAGWIANSLIRNGEQRATEYFRAEVRRAGFKA